MGSSHCMLSTGGIITVRIMIDLDAMLAAYGTPDKPEKKETAIKLIREVKAGKHELYTSYTLMDIVAGFNIEYFRKKIHRFYVRYSKDIITAKRLEEKLSSSGKEIKALLKKFTAIGIKEEDAVLATISSVFEVELKTFNKKHLLNKREEINKILREEDMNEIIVNEP